MTKTCYICKHVHIHKVKLKTQMGEGDCSFHDHVHFSIIFKSIYMETRWKCDLQGCTARVINSNISITSRWENAVNTEKLEEGLLSPNVFFLCCFQSFSIVSQLWGPCCHLNAHKKILSAGDYIIIKPDGLNIILSFYTQGDWVTCGLLVSKQCSLYFHVFIFLLLINLEMMSENHWCFLFLFVSNRRCVVQTQSTCSQTSCLLWLPCDCWCLVGFSMRFHGNESEGAVCLRAD